MFYVIIDNIYKGVVSMNFMLDKTMYDLLVKIKNVSEYRCVMSNDDLLYLSKSGFTDYHYDGSIYCCSITPKGRVAIRNYAENEKSIFFNKLISIATLVFAFLTLLVSVFTLCCSI